MNSAGSMIGSIDSFLSEVRGKRFSQGTFYGWRYYRRDIAALITGACEENSTVAVFGAGQCDDIHLKTFAGHFGTTLLIDSDLEAMKRGVMRFSEDGNSSIRMINRFFTGLTNRDYREFAALAVSTWKDGPDIDALVRKLDAIYSRASQCQLSFLNNEVTGAEGFDYGVVLGVHSQLNSMFSRIYKELREQTGKPIEPGEDDPVLKRIAQETAHIETKFNSAVMESVTRKLVIGYEKEEGADPGSRDWDAGSILGSAELRRPGMRGEGSDVVMHIDIVNMMTSCC